MDSFENTITIRRSREDVFDFLADLENVPRWNYAIEQTRKVTPGPVTVGTVYEQTRTIPKRADERLTLTKLEPPRELEVAGTLGPFAAELRYTLEPADTGTRLRNTVKLQLSGPLGLLSGLAVPRVKEAIATNLDTLRELLEGARVSGSPSN